MVLCFVFFFSFLSFFHLLFFSFSLAGQRTVFFGLPPMFGYPIGEPRSFQLPPPRGSLTGQFGWKTDDSLRHRGKTRIQAWLQGFAVLFDCSRAEAWPAMILEILVMR